MGVSRYKFLIKILCSLMNSVFINIAVEFEWYDVVKINVPLDTV